MPLKSQTGSLEFTSDSAMPANGEPPAFGSMLALLAWPSLTWATGSDDTGYALTRAGWIAGAVWLGVLVVWAAVIFVCS